MLQFGYFGPHYRFIWPIWRGTRPALLPILNFSIALGDNQFPSVNNTSTNF